MMSLHLPPHMRPPMCLQYIILALGADMTKIYRKLAIPFYQRSRTYMQSDEMKVGHELLRQRKGQHAENHRERANTLPRLRTHKPGV